jgi:hypothetical protein
LFPSIVEKSFSREFVFMPGIPADDPEQEKNPEIMLHRWLELAVPLLSFGGAVLAVILLITNAPLDYRVTILGCVLASWVLAYLAWIRPRKDIVALSTPLYSFIFLAVPTDVFSAIVLELLYAASLTILLVRLKYRFGSTGTSGYKGKELTGPLKTYIGQTSASLSGTGSGTAHSAAIAFVRFAEGNYGDAARVSGTASGQMEETGGNPCLTQAFNIVREHATLLETSSPPPLTFLTFSAEDGDLLAKPETGSPQRDQEFYAALDNALLLLFSAAWNASERDRAHLIACQPFAQKLLME